MSVHVLSWVLRNSETVHAERLVLIVLADHARGDGSLAWPAIGTIAREARLSERTVRRCLRRLEEAGDIRETGRSASGTHVYRVVMDGEDILTGGTYTAKGGDRMTPEPSLDQPSLRPHPSTTSQDVVAPAAASAQTLVADVVDDSRAAGIPVSSRHRGILGRQAKDLLDSEFDYDLVKLAAVTAIRRGQPQNLHYIASDLAAAHAGQRITRREYERALEDAVETGTPILGEAS